MNNKILTAKALLATAKAILSDYDYIYDPDHKKRPGGGGWAKTDKGWSKSPGGAEKHALSEDDALKEKDYEKISSHPFEDVRAKLAENQNTPPKVFNSLARDMSPLVRAKVAGNPNAPGETLVRLAGDSDTKVCRRAWKSNTRPASSR